MNRNPVTWSDILRLFGMFVFCERQRPTSTNGSHIENGSIWNATRTLLKHSRFSRGRWRFRVIPSGTVYVVHAVSVAVITPRVVVVYIRTIGTRPSVLRVHWAKLGRDNNTAASDNGGLRRLVSFETPGPACLRPFRQLPYALYTVSIASGEISASRAAGTNDARLSLTTLRRSIRRRETIDRAVRVLRCPEKKELCWVQ